MIREVKTHFILYVADRRSSSQFYSSVPAISSTLDVPGLTEFQLSDAVVLSLIPEASAERLLAGQVLIAYPPAERVSRCEIYMLVDDTNDFRFRALAAGARELSPLTRRDRGHTVAYSLDADGHVLCICLFKR